MLGLKRNGVCLTGWLLVWGAVCFGGEPEKTLPNIVVFLADDMGWTGPGCYGSDLHLTPHLDQLAASGMKFTDGYAACTVCSPTRASVMTGKYPARLHLTDWIKGQNRPQAKMVIPDWTMYLDLEETTIAELLKSQGYKTCHVGKWHLGDEPYWPEYQGFDENVGGTDSGSPRGGYHLPNGIYKDARKGEYLTDRLTDDAIAFIEASVDANFDAEKDEPFFLNFDYYTVHTPIQGKADYIKAYEERLRPGQKHSNPIYAAMHQSLDESVGRVLDKLDELGIADSTVIFFLSDNGGLSHKFGKETGIVDNAPLRRGKGSAYEGGHRVPFIVRWPGVTQSNSVSNEPVCSVDLLPTICSIVGVKPGLIDGVDLTPVLNDPHAGLDRDALYWHYPHYHAGGDGLDGLAQGPYGAIRQGDWKLIEFYEDMRFELYNLANDISESNNLATTHPELAEELRAKLHQWRKEVDAQMPTKRN